MKYQPNFQDPRTQRRIKSALGFVRACFSDDKPQAWSTRYIDRFLGQQQHSLGAWLRHYLLTTSNDSWNWSAGICKQYVRNTIGYQYVSDCLFEECFIPFGYWKQTKNLRTRDYLGDLVENKSIYNIPYCITSQNTCYINEWITQEFDQELKTLNFEYMDKSSRLWHPLQRVRRQYKQQILSQAGLPHQYDIVCAAPTLLHQHSWRIPEQLDSQGRWQSGPMDLWLDTLRGYIRDRHSLRHQLAQDLEIPESTAKTIITALFCGAQISRNSQTDIYKLLLGDVARIECLKQHTQIQNLRDDIRVMWWYLSRVMPRRFNSETGRLLPISNRQKWLLYFEIERQVLDSVRSFLNENNTKCFLEHDGWSTDRKIDILRLQNWVFDQTGYRIEIEYKN